MMIYCFSCLKNYNQETKETFSLTKRKTPICRTLFMRVAFFALRVAAPMHPLCNHIKPCHYYQLLPKRKVTRSCGFFFLFSSLFTLHGSPTVPLPTSLLVLNKKHLCPPARVFFSFHFRRFCGKIQS